MEPELKRLLARFYACRMLDSYKPHRLTRSWLDTGDVRCQKFVYKLELYLPLPESMIGFSDLPRDHELKFLNASDLVRLCLAYSASFGDIDVVLENTSIAAQEAKRRMAWSQTDKFGNSIPREERKAVGTQIVEEEIAAQSHARELVLNLSGAIKEWGLSARLLDVVRENPWFAREVVRAQRLPGLELWVEWHRSILDGDNP